MRKQVALFALGNEVAMPQVVNDTQLRLEVALVEVQRRPSGRSSSSRPAGFDRADSMVRSQNRPWTLTAVSLTPLRRECLCMRPWPGSVIVMSPCGKGAVCCESTLVRPPWRRS